MLLGIWVNLIGRSQEKTLNQALLFTQAKVSSWQVTGRWSCLKPVYLENQRSEFKPLFRGQKAWLRCLVPNQLIEILKRLVLTKVQNSTDGSASIGKNVAPAPARIKQYCITTMLPAPGFLQACFYLPAAE